MIVARLESKSHTATMSDGGGLEKIAARKGTGGGGMFAQGAAGKCADWLRDASEKFKQAEKTFLDKLKTRI